MPASESIGRGIRGTPKSLASQHDPLSFCFHFFCPSVSLPLVPTTRSLFLPVSLSLRVSCPRCTLRRKADHQACALTIWSDRCRSLFFFSLSPPGCVVLFRCLPSNLPFLNFSLQGEAGLVSNNKAEKDKQRRARRPQDD